MGETTNFRMRPNPQYGVHKGARMKQTLGTSAKNIVPMTSASCASWYIREARSLLGLWRLYIPFRILHNELVYRERHPN